MFLQKAIVILIGNNGIIIANSNGKDIEQKFIESLNDGNRVELINFFKKHRSQKIYILLDTIDQTYKKKSYPSIKKSDLEKIIKRDLAGDGDKEALKNYIILKKTKQESIKLTLNFNKNSTGKLDCLFISSSKSQLINNWLSFVYELPNRLIGVYMLPIESYNFYQNLYKIKEKNKNQSTDLKNILNTNIHCLVIQTKVGGARQIVFSGENIVFTRVVNYNITDENFAEKYIQDIYSTFEYLKRMFIELTIDKFQIINIFPDSAFQKILALGNKEIQQINHTPTQAQEMIGAKNIKIETEDRFDLLIIMAFLKEKPILKFTTHKIKELENSYLQFKSILITNIAMLAILIFGLLFLFFSNKNIIEDIETAENEKITLSKTLSLARKTAIEGASLEGEKQDISIEIIGDTGKVEEILGEFQPNFSETYASLSFAKDITEITSFKYRVTDFNSKSPNKGAKKEMVFNGILFNRSGTIDDLFIEFDNFINKKLKSTLTNFDVKYTEINRNIDFNAKFYEQPIEFTLLEKRNQANIEKQDK